MPSSEQMWHKCLWIQMNWDRYHGLALPTASEVLPRVTETVSDRKMLWFIRKYPRHEWDTFIIHVVLQNCVYDLVNMVCSRINGLPRRDLQGLTDSSLPIPFTACQASLQPIPRHTGGGHRRESPGRRMKSDILVSVPEKLLALTHLEAPFSHHGHLEKRVCVCVPSCSIMSNSLWSYGLEPTRLLCPWDFSGKNTGVGCHFLQPRDRIRSSSIFGIVGGFLTC